MVVFETQEAFENAVMEVLKQRLDVHVSVHNRNDETVKVEIDICDGSRTITSDMDYA